METVASLGERLIALLTEAPKEDKPKEQQEAPAADNQQDDAEAELGDGNAPENAFSAAPAAPPELPASDRECLYTDIAMQALMFDFSKVPPKSLVMFQMTNPEQILHFVKKVIDYKQPTSFTSGSETAAPEIDPMQKPEPMLARQKMALAQLILKALKYDSKQLNVDVEFVGDKVTPQSAKKLQKELSVLLGI